VEESSTELAEPGPSRTGATRVNWHGIHKALADPLRIRLLEWLAAAPRSARELADCAGLAADRLYYHLAQLEQAKLIEIVEYRPLPRGKVERVYAPVRTEPPAGDADPEETAAFLGSVLQATAMDITAACQARKAGHRREIDLHRGAVRLTDEALAELRGHIEQLAARFADSAADADADGGGSGTWTRVVVTLVDVQDRPEADPPPRSPA
jgi:DNA-binding transcriptional ArsR family regulator